MGRGSWTTFKYVNTGAKKKKGTTVAPVDLAPVNMTPPPQVDIQKLLDEQAKLEQQIQSAYQQRYTDIMGLFTGMGDQQRKDIQRQFAEKESKGAQDLVDSGLAGSTVMPSMRMGFQRELSDALSRAEEQLRSEAVDAASQLSKAALDAAQLGANRRLSLAQIQQTQQTALWGQQRDIASQKVAEQQNALAQQRNQLEQQRIAADQANEALRYATTLAGGGGVHYITPARPPSQLPQGGYTTRTVMQPVYSSAAPYSSLTSGNRAYEALHASSRTSSSSLRPSYSSLRPSSTYNRAGWHR